MAGNAQGQVCTAATQAEHMLLLHSVVRARPPAAEVFSPQIHGGFGLCWNHLEINLRSHPEYSGISGVCLFVWDCLTMVDYHRGWDLRTYLENFERYLTMIPNHRILEIP